MEYKIEDLNEKQARAADKWAYYRECTPKKRKKLSDHEFAFRIDDTGAGWEYVHFELDEETSENIRRGIRAIKKMEASIDEGRFGPNGE